MRMAILTDAVVATLAVLGVYLLLWMISATLSGPVRPGSGERLTALLSVRGGAPRDAADRRETAAPAQAGYC